MVRLGQRKAIGTLTLGAVMALAACGSSNNTTSSGGATSNASNIGGNVTVWAVWSGTEQEDFQAVLDGFNSKTGVTGQFQSKGDQLPTVLGTAISGGAPPDVAILPQPGLLHDLVAKNALKPIDSFVGARLTSQYASVLAEARQRRRQDLRRLLQGRQQEHRLVQRQGLHRRRHHLARRRRSTSLLTDMSTLQQAGTTPFAMCGGSRMDAHRLVRERVPARRRRGQVQRARCAHDPVD